eukprot:Platyproteum_vivax@DN7597_c0_g2_i3.p1
MKTVPVDGDLLEEQKVETSSLDKEVVEEASKKKEKPKQVSVCKLFAMGSAVDFIMLFFGCICSAASGCVMPLFSVVFGNLITELGGANAASTVTRRLLLVLVYLGCGAFVVGALGVGLLELQADRQCKKIRIKYFQKILAQEMAYFDTHNPSEFATQMADDVRVVREGIGIKLGQLFQFAAMFIAGLTVGFVYGWRLALVILACLPLLVGTGVVLMYLTVDNGAAGGKAYAAAGGVAEEVFMSMRTVAAFGGEDKVAVRYEHELEEAEKVGVKKGFYTGSGLGSAMAVMFASYALAFWYGGELILKSRDAYGPRNKCTEGSDANCFKPGTVLTVFFGVLMGSFGLGQASPAINALMAALTAGHRIFSVVDRQSELDPLVLQDGPAPQAWEEKHGEYGQPLEGDIVFKDVTFRFPTRPERPVLDKLNLVVPHGQTVALVGPSGCGKSTIISLVERFYDPEEGTITIGDKNVKDFNVRWFRSRIGMVQQEPRLFAVSIKENIRLGTLDTEVSEERIIECAKNANAHDFIMQIPAGYETNVGDGGSQLSGGQKQRVAIARAIIRDPEVLILDEATSALDNESERIVQEALDNLMAAKKRTTIVIAHRLTTIKNADKIVVVDEGKVIEEGTHTTL